MNSYTSEGFVLKRMNFAEADRILTVFSKDLGHITLLAKGVRRPKSKKRGHVEIFSLVKFAAVKSHGMDIVTEAEIINDYSGVRKNLKKVALIYYICEVVDKITHDGEKNPAIFELLRNNMERVENTKRLKELRMEFITEILIILGYWPKDRIMENPDLELEKVLERQVGSARVGKIISS
jgi:DNA repair protein RecO (recombination protein O)